MKVYASMSTYVLIVSVYHRIAIFSMVYSPKYIAFPLKTLENIHNFIIKTSDAPYYGEAQIYLIKK